MTSTTGAAFKPRAALYSEEVFEFRGFSSNLESALYNLNQNWECRRGGILSFRSDHLRHFELKIPVENSGSSHLVLSTSYKLMWCTCHTDLASNAAAVASVAKKKAFGRLYLGKDGAPDGMHPYYFFALAGRRAEILSHLSPRSPTGAFTRDELVAYAQLRLSHVLSCYSPTNYSRFQVLTELHNDLSKYAKLGVAEAMAIERSDFGDHDTQHGCSFLQSLTFQLYDNDAANLAVTANILQGEAGSYHSPPVGSLHHARNYTLQNSIYSGRPLPAERILWGNLCFSSLAEFLAYYRFGGKDSVLFIPISSHIFDNLDCFSADDRANGQSCYIFCSPAQLYALFTILKSNSLANILAYFMDAKFKFFRVGAQKTCLIDLATVHVGLHGHPDHVSRSNMSLVHCIAPGELKVCVYAMTRSFIDAVHFLFGYTIDISVFCSDRSSAIRSGIQLLPEASGVVLAVCAEHSRNLPMNSWATKIRSLANRKRIVLLLSLLYKCGSTVNAHNYALVLASYCLRHLHEPEFGAYLAEVVITGKFSVNYHYSCTGMLGVTPMTQALERYWETLQGNRRLGILPKAFSNVAIEKVLQQVCPRICATDGLVIEKLNVGVTDEAMKLPSRLLSYRTIVWASLISKNTDVYQLPNDEYIISRPQRLGLGINADDIVRYDRELSVPQDNPEETWQHLNVSPARYIEITDGFCKVKAIHRQNPESRKKLAHLSDLGMYYFCSCCTFWEQLICPASAYLENERGNIFPSIQDLLKQPFSGNSTGRRHMRNRRAAVSARTSAPLREILAITGLPEEFQNDLLFYMVVLSDPQLKHLRKDRKVPPTPKSSRSKANHILAVVEGTHLGEEIVQQRMNVRRESTYDFNAAHVAAQDRSRGTYVSPVAGDDQRVYHDNTQFYDPYSIGDDPECVADCKAFLTAPLQGCFNHTGLVLATALTHGHNNLRGYSLLEDSSVKRLGDMVLRINTQGKTLGEVRDIAKDQALIPRTGVGGYPTANSMSITEIITETLTYSIPGNTMEMTGEAASDAFAAISDYLEQPHSDQGYERSLSSILTFKNQTFAILRYNEPEADETVSGGHIHEYHVFDLHEQKIWMQGTQLKNRAVRCVIKGPAALCCFLLRAWEDTILHSFARSHPHVHFDIFMGPMLPVGQFPQLGVGTIIDNHDLGISIEEIVESNMRHYQVYVGQDILPQSAVAVGEPGYGNGGGDNGNGGHHGGGGSHPQQHNLITQAAQEAGAALMAPTAAAPVGNAVNAAMNNLQNVQAVSRGIYNAGAGAVARSVTRAGTAGTAAANPAARLVRAVAHSVGRSSAARSSRQGSAQHTSPIWRTYFAGTIRVHIVLGSLLNFEDSEGATVTVTNPACLRANGIDQLITRAGGPSLLSAREAMPCNDGVRCPHGSAKMVGPCVFGTLRTPYLIHCVGPDLSITEKKLGNRLLKKCYKEALNCALGRRTPPIKSLALTPISCGQYLGPVRYPEHVMTIGIKAIREWCCSPTNDGNTQLTDIYLFAKDEQWAGHLVFSCSKVLISPRENLVIDGEIIRRIRREDAHENILEDSVMEDASGVTGMTGPAARLSIDVGNIDNLSEDGSSTDSDTSMEDAERQALRRASAEELRAAVNRDSESSDQDSDNPITQPRQGNQLVHPMNDNDWEQVEAPDDWLPEAMMNEAGVANEPLAADQRVPPPHEDQQQMGEQHDLQDEMNENPIMETNQDTNLLVGNIEQAPPGEHNEELLPMEQNHQQQGEQQLAAHENEEPPQAQNEEQIALGDEQQLVNHENEPQLDVAEEPQGVLAIVRAVALVEESLGSDRDMENEEDAQRLAAEEVERLSVLALAAAAKKEEIRVAEELAELCRRLPWMAIPVKMEQCSAAILKVAAEDYKPDSSFWKEASRICCSQNENCAFSVPSRFKNLPGEDDCSTRRNFGDSPFMQKTRQLMSPTIACFKSTDDIEERCMQNIPHLQDALLSVFAVRQDIFQSSDWQNPLMYFMTRFISLKFMTSPISAKNLMEVYDHLSVQNVNRYRPKGTRKYSSDLDLSTCHYVHVPDPWGISYIFNTRSKIATRFIDSHTLLNAAAVKREETILLNMSTIISHARVRHGGTIQDYKFTIDHRHIGQDNEDGQTEWMDHLTGIKAGSLHMLLACVSASSLSTIGHQDYAADVISEAMENAIRNIDAVRMYMMIALLHNKTTPWVDDPKSKYTHVGNVEVFQSDDNQYSEQVSTLLQEARVGIGNVDISSSRGILGHLDFSQEKQDYDYSKNRPWYEEDGVTKTGQHPMGCCLCLAMNEIEVISKNCCGLVLCHECCIGILNSNGNTNYLSSGNFMHRSTRCPTCRKGANYVFINSPKKKVKVTDPADGRKREIIGFHNYKSVSGVVTKTKIFDQDLWMALCNQHCPYELEGNRDTFRLNEYDELYGGRLQDYRKKHWEYEHKNVGNEQCSKCNTVDCKPWNMADLGYCHETCHYRLCLDCLAKHVKKIDLHAEGVCPRCFLSGKYMSIHSRMDMGGHLREYWSKNMFKIKPESTQKDVKQFIRRIHPNIKVSFNTRENE